MVAAPITSGDTAFRSARLIIADFAGIQQKSIRNRLFICIPMFLAASLLLWYNVADENGFNVIWRYFGWANQTLAVFALWAATSYLARRKGSLAYLITLLPAVFMTAVCTTYICIAKIGFNMPGDWNFAIGAVTIVASFVLFFWWKINYDKNAR